MNKTFKLTILLVAATFLLAGTAMAVPFNTRPIVFGPGTFGESSMQTILDTVLDTSIDAYSGQNSAAIWTQDEFDVTSYRIVSITSGSGNLYVYSYDDPTTKVLLDVSSGSANFDVDVDGVLTYNGATVSDFGQYFGFAWNNYYTEDDLNNDTARALSYLVAGGTYVDLTDDNLSTLTGTINWVGGVNGASRAQGDNDWILGFEDGTDGDYQDAVFYIEDMSPVPEPATMLLLGTGLVGVAVGARRRMKKS